MVQRTLTVVVEIMELVRGAKVIEHTKTENA